MKQKKTKLLSYCSNEKLKSILNKASREDVYKFYIDEDLDRSEVAEKLNITQTELCVLLDYYKIRKDMSTRMKKTRRRQLENMTPEKARKIKQKELATKAAKTLEEKQRIKDKELKTKMLLKKTDPDKYWEIQDQRNKTHSETLQSKPEEFWTERAEKFRESLKKSLPQAIKKNHATKRKNKTFNTSKSEVFVANYLKNLYSIETNYKSAEYPFNCDIYIKDLDIYVEINGHWTHGSNPFNPENEKDIKELEKIKSRQKYYKTNRGLLKENSYFAAEKVWTQRDPLKLKFAKNNNLTYIVLYNINVTNKINIDKINFKKLKGSGINIIDMRDLL